MIFGFREAFFVGDVKGTDFEVFEQVSTVPDMVFVSSIWGRFR